MKRVPKSAEESNAIPTADKQNNNAAFSESGPKGNASNKSGGEVESKTHGFSKTLAEIKNSKGEPLGYNAAIILRYLSAISRKYGRNIDGKRWVRVNLDHISEQYPYMGRSTVDDNIIRLEQFGCCEKQNGLVELKRRKNDRTRCYHIPKKWVDATEDTPRYFNSAVAQAIKVPAAVIYYNFCHWLGVNKEEEHEQVVKLSPATLVKLLPFSESTVKRSLKTLEAEKYIQPVPGRICWYAETIQELRGSNPDDKGSNPDEKGPDPDEKGPDPDNYIDCNELVDELEKNSKPKPAASVFENPADDKQTNDDESHLFDDGIATNADEQDRNEMGHDNVAEPASNPSSEQATATSTGSENDYASTSDIPGEAFDVKGEWPDVPNYEYLHGKNQSLSAVVREIENMPGGVRDSLLSTVHDICVTVLSQIDQQITDELFANADKEEIVHTLLPYHQQFFTLSTLTTEHPLFDILYYGSLEAMVGAMLWEHDRLNKYSHPMTMLNSVTYKVHLVFWRRAEDLRTKAVDEEFSQWRNEYASADEHKENDPDLSPREKMRVFRNALNTKNKVGWIWFDQTHQTQRIQVSKSGLQRIQKLFELNPDLTPAELLPIVDGCMNEYSGRPAPPKKFVRGAHWHARMGHRLHIFASYLETIIKQLGMKSPVDVYLSDANVQAEDGVALAA